MLNKVHLLFFLLSSNFSLLNASYAFDFIEVKPDEIDKGLTLDLGVMKNFKGSQLCSVAENTKHYIDTHSDDTFAVKAGNVFGQKSTFSAQSSIYGGASKLRRSRVG